MLILRRPPPRSAVKVMSGLSMPSGSRKFWFSHMTTCRHRCMPHFINTIIYNTRHNWYFVFLSRHAHTVPLWVNVSFYPLRSVIDAECDFSCGFCGWGVNVKVIHREARQLTCDFKYVELCTGVNEEEEEKNAPSCDFFEIPPLYSFMIPSP